MKAIVFFICILLVYGANAQLTTFEKSNGKKTATYFETIDFYKQLDKASAMLSMKEMGATDANYPLHLVMISADGKFEPAKWHQQKKVVMLINNGIHPGEPDGIDASMMLARDLINKKLIIPENVIVAIIPVYNIGGCLNRNSYTRANQNGPEEYGFRGNSQNLDLNRDFTKGDSKEARSFAALFHWLDPDIFLDNHVSDGADYQHTMTMITTQYDKLGPMLGKWLKSTLEPAIYKGMKTKGWDLIPYVDFDNDDIDKGINMFFEPPRYSSGYAALFNTMSFIAETHMLKEYAQRVRSTYDLMSTFIESSSTLSEDIYQQRKNAKESVLMQHSFPISWKQDTTVFSEIIFKGYEKSYTKSEATGLKKMFYDHSKPFTKQVKFLNSYKPLSVVEKPKAYIIPHGWQSVIDLLKLNDVKLEQLKTDSIMELTVYHVDDYKSLPKAIEKHHKNYAVSVSLSKQKVKLLKGDYIVYTNQTNCRYITEMLEPTADDSFFAWNFFDAILRQKEGYSDYRWEDIAATVLRNDPQLQRKLEEKKAADPQFAANSTQILDFIYQNSPYAEKAFLRYPVFRIDNE